MDPLTGEKCAGDVLLVGGLALWDLTSEVSPPKKRALLAVRAWGLDETLGRREYAPGKAWPTKEEKNPLSVSREAARSLYSGNSERLLGSLASPGVQVCPGQSGVPPHEKKQEGPSVHLQLCCHPPLSTMPEPSTCSESGPFLITAGAGP